MRLRAIEITHVGALRGPVRIGPFAPGLNVLAADNEAGKSTVIRAAVRALFDKHTSKDGDIKSLRPAGTELTPKVAVEFETGGGVYRIEKSFLQSPRSHLHEWRGAAWHLLAEADAADQRTQTLLEGSLPSRGASKPEHWGLLGFLWARQGESANWPSLGDDTGRRIRQQLARIEMDPLIERARAWLAAKAEEIITATGQPKAGGPLRGAQDELQQIDSELARARQSLEQLDELRRQFDHHTEQAARLQNEHAECEERLAMLSQQEKQSEQLQLELEKLRSDLQQARGQLDLVTLDVEALGKWNAELAEAGKKAAALAERAGEQHAATERAREAIAARELELAALEGKLGALRQEHVRVNSLARLRRLKGEHEQRMKTFAEASKAAAELAALERQRAQLPALNAAAVKKLDQLSVHVRDLEVQARAAGLALTLKPRAAATVEIKQPGGSETLKLPANKLKQITASQSVELNLAGWGSVTVQSGSAELRQLAVELEQGKQALAQALLELQCASLDAAREALAARQQAELEIKSGIATLRALLGEHADLAACERQLAESAQQARHLEQTLAPTEAELTATAVDLDQRLGEIAAKISLAENERIAHRAALDQLRRDERAGLDAAQFSQRQLADCQIERKTMEAKIAATRARHGGQPDQALTAARSQFVQAEARLEVAQAKLPADFSQLAGRRQRASKALLEVAAQLQQARKARDEAAGSLAALGGQGLYSRETELMERREQTLIRRDAARDRGWAARIAHELIGFRKQAATRAVLAPLEERLTAAFARITGEAERRVFLDEDLQITGIGRSREAAHDFELLSQGAREQLLLCLRVAAAGELAAAGETQVLILDDVLVNTDAARQQRVLDLLAEAAASLQIVILTCHAERYRGIGEPLRIEPLTETRP